MVYNNVDGNTTSRPARGGWIEINRGRVCGERTHSPAPHGAGGLKWVIIFFILLSLMSRPARGGWVEIVKAGGRVAAPLSRPARGGWIEI